MTQPQLHWETHFDQEDVVPLDPAWNKDIAQRALDDLFALTDRYRTSEAYQTLIDFVASFKLYSPYNAMLVHTQMPGATYVAPPGRWLSEYGRVVKPSEHPLVILQPMGPVMFVYDVSQTEPTKSAIPLPPEVQHPFQARGGMELPRYNGYGSRE